MLSVAHIHFSFTNFTGIICDFYANNKEYKFTSYYGAILKKYDVSEKSISIEIKQGNKLLLVSSISENPNTLISPSKGKMNTQILESLSSKINIQLLENNKIIFSDYSLNCGLEIVI